ncbi:MAG: hypothetical protein EA403_13570 [Spirochaetaceae bacterium]|nr:MAG: hypothetical protein EA403_13570 [Spirochaetaceae bacterium]
MNFNTHKPLFIISFLFLVALVTSIVWLVVDTRGSIERVLFFPGTLEAGLQGEPRLMPRHRNMDRDVRVLIDEIVLGPSVLGFTRVVPRDTRVRSVMIRRGIAYIDLDGGFLAGQQFLMLSVEDALDAVRHTVQFNFRRIATVVITIDGQIPGQPVFEVGLTVPRLYDGNRKKGIDNRESITII